MDRRDFVKALVAGGALLEAGSLALGQEAKPAQQPQTAKDPNNMTPLEAHHVPKIEPGKPGVKAGEDLPVAIKIEHPMKPEHHIVHIEVFMDDKKVGTYTLTPEVTKPEITVVLTPQKSFELVVQDLCNIHGLWENRKKIEVA
jgi:superoxide reductase